MNAQPLYFGPAGRPLFAWLHAPASGAVRAAAVLCPSLGLEALAAHRTYRRLADELAVRGVAALRLDYDGTGDSAGSQSDPDRVAAWTGSIEAAVTALREWGAPAVVAVGMRAGALLAGDVAGRVALDGLVVWDPPRSGRTFLREQRALRLVAVDVPAATEGGTLEGSGIDFDAATVATLGALDLVLPRGTPTLVLRRSEHRDATAVDVTAAAAGAEVADAVGQAELLDVLPDVAQVPATLVERVAEWCDRLSAELPAVPLRPAARSECVLVAEDGRRVVERPQRLGPAGLFAVVTEPEWRPGAPTVLLSNAGVLYHVGPARAWVELARQLAGGGIRVARMDQSGIGESPPRAGAPEEVVYAPEAIDDFAEAAAALAPGSPRDVVLAGLCSGAYHAIETGRLLGTRYVCALNPILTFAPVEVAAGEGADDRRVAAQPLRWPFRVLARHGRFVAIGERLPPLAWWLLDRLNLQPSPGRGLERLAEGGTELLLVCGEGDGKPFRQRARPTLRRLRREGRLRFEVVPGLDHTMLASCGRRAAVGIVAHELLARFGSVPAGDREPATGKASNAP